MFLGSDRKPCQALKSRPYAFLLPSYPDQASCVASADEATDVHIMFAVHPNTLHVNKRP